MLRRKYAQGEAVIQTPSMASWAWVASAVVHVSVALAVAPGGSRAGQVAGGAKETIDVDVDEPVATAEVSQDDPRAPVVRAAVVRAVPSPSALPREVSRRLVAVARTGSNAGGPDVPPAVVAASGRAAPRFFMAFGTMPTETGGRSKVGGSGAEEDGEDTETYPESVVSSRAHLLEGRAPEYPAAARAAAVEAELPLEIVVDALGSVVDARLLRHAGYGLDEAALRAVRSYRFSPARRAGREVSVRMRWVVDFRLD